MGHKKRRKIGSIRKSVRSGAGVRYGSRYGSRAGARARPRTERTGGRANQRSARARGQESAESTKEKVPAHGPKPWHGGAVVNVVSISKTRIEFVEERERR